jgi:DNA (cytosine-5)-methyltransferase 1
MTPEPAPDSMPTFIDLFCGCGGFSLGFIRAGFTPLAAIDNDAIAIKTLRTNLPQFQHVLEEDLTRFAPESLRATIGATLIDVIVGGPPCQGFSTARQRDGANHGTDRLVPDERRDLYREFLRFVAFFQPKVFVIENVPGIRSAAGGYHYTRIQKLGRSLGYRMHTQTEDASRLGLPQKRRRQLIFGVRRDISKYFLPALYLSERSSPGVSLGVALGDLPALQAGEGNHEMEYDIGLRRSHIGSSAQAGKYLKDVLEIDKAPILTNHVSRPHSARDLRDFARLREGENSSTAIRRHGTAFEFPYDKATFKDRFTRQSRSALCSTIVAHLAKDGLMFIHPTQNRSLTPREAARIQSFPDWFEFPRARTHAFRLIGNAVPPLVGECIGLAVRKFLAGAGSADPLEAQFSLFFDDSAFYAATLGTPKRRAAGELILPLVGWTRAELEGLEEDRLLAAWQAILALFPLLHPTGVLDPDGPIEHITFSRNEIETWEEIFAARYVRTGWPVVFEHLGKEVFRRRELGKLDTTALYTAKLPALRRRAKPMSFSRTPRAHRYSR